ncbi:MAG: adenylate/guanylate cyclase domain-containing protein [Alphaproteobacteria bacterium]|nr:adenylate/guanylate cyclase domain-containing protein [Alphaproteobacteria bacterium]
MTAEVSPSQSPDTVTANPGPDNPSEINYQHLPERVKRAIRHQQDASEILIGWVQLAVVSLFGTLYLLSPKTFANDAEFAPVPWVLGGYLAFSVVKLAFVHRRRAPDWLLYLSVVLDMGLLFGLIWSFHLQYMQPPTFYLKVPTLLYVFIFIALRALRFQARFVVVAGLVAAAGWTLLALYAMAGPDGVKMITRDYIQYMTSNSVLIGAEIDKVVSILTVTAIIAVAISRARHLLVRAVAEGAAAHDLSRFFAPEIAQQITAAEQKISIGEGQAREAAILFCDIRGFTVFANTVSPTVLMAALAEYQSRIVPIIREHGGSIDKFMGDGIMATFGAAVTTDSFAADALRAVNDIMVEVERWNVDRVGAEKPILRVGAACAAGRIIFGAVGDETRLEYTVIGDAVNLAAKLEKQTKEEVVKALTDAKTLKIAEAQGFDAGDDIERLAARKVEGIDVPVDLVVLAK